MKGRGKCCIKGKCSTNNKRSHFDLVDIENMAFNKLYVDPSSNTNSSEVHFNNNEIQEESRAAAAAS
jgi:hypothetical protein